ncbi:hypothetical protein CKN99_12515 [Carnobacterium maltaromaticum]|nr:hypothetical protein CKN90_12475 [Carnobacterium maltaromaticum]TFJ30594.1 hypothetical protein CKN98_12480 [Carnobacterium maltaromaticum]TFJ33675.1 hypothetical protein CKN88_12435 [Carnobacterium maltaromaticum]TFJ36426.1 hypothetical protein CKN99_12515 [Carnobacterium maltaromaticum]TFJ43587.1 hypothetical protein CKN92_11950 [Carnobacterium maltaromaticum]
MILLKYTNSSLYGITTKKHLSYILKMNLGSLSNIEPLFCANSFSKKKNNKSREFYNPTLEQRAVLNRINVALCQIGAPNYAYGGIKGRSYIDNAKVHSGQKALFLIDISNFFPSTRDKYVYKFFKNKLAMSTDVATILTLVVTEKLFDSDKRFLPQGYPTSPLLSLFAYIEMFESINKIAINNDLKYTCYYDDLTLSSSSYIDKKILRQVKKEISSYDLKVNDFKTRALFNKASKLTGVVVSPEKIVAPGKLQLQMIDNFSKLMDAIYSGKMTTKIEINELCNKVQGCLASIKSIEPDRDLTYYVNKLKIIRQML